MRLHLVVGSFVVLAGCDFNRSTRSSDDYSHAALSGVITLPHGPSDVAEALCSNLRVEVRSPDGALLGKPAIHAGTGHCSYEVRNLPGNTELDVKVVPGTSWQCGNGGVATFKGGAVTLGSEEQRVADFRVQCAQPG